MTISVTVNLPPDIDDDINSLKDFLGLARPMLVIADTSLFVVLIAIGNVGYLANPVQRDCWRTRS